MKKLGCLVVAVVVLALLIIFVRPMTSLAADEIGRLENDVLYFNLTEMSDRGILYMAMRAPEGMALSILWQRDASAGFQYRAPWGYPSHQKMRVEEIPSETSKNSSRELLKFQWDQVRVLWIEELEEYRMDFQILEREGDYAFFMGDGLVGCFELLGVLEPEPPEYWDLEIEHN